MATDSTALRSDDGRSSSSSSTYSILVVDDEASIRTTIEGVLRDAGFEVSVARNGEEALDFVANNAPDLVMLDIWMPGLDGLETLSRLREISPQIPVIMISGHATISTAVHASRVGAVDFLEKPLDLEQLLRSVRSALQVEHSGTRVTSTPVVPVEEKGETLSLGRNRETVERQQVVFAKQNLRGKARPQRTLSGNALLYGRGLHSGQKSGLILEPLPPHSGIHFVGVSQRSAVPAHVDFVESTGFATRLKLGDMQVSTVEHIMSALCAYGISNLLIKCNDEVPVMDGSAREFCALLEATGIQEQQGEWYDIAVTREIRIGDDREFIAIEPADTFSIDYTLDYPAPLGRQHFYCELEDPQFYAREIAPARTFGLVKDIGALQRAGLAQGGRFDNFVLYGEEGPLNSELRFPDEAVRHKVLDAIGDLYLLGRRLQGRITAQMTGHSDNIALLKRIKQELRRRS